MQIDFKILPQIWRDIEVFGCIKEHVRVFYFLKQKPFSRYDLLTPTEEKNL